MMTHRMICRAIQGRVALAIIVPLVCACLGCLSGEDDLVGTKFRCDTSADCGSGWQCDTTIGYCVAAYNDRNGVFSDKILLGMSAALEDDVPALAPIARASRDGIRAYFAHINRTGGVHGRKLELLLRNDSYDPAQTTTNLEEIASGANRQVFAILNVIGTGTSLAAKAVALAEKVLFFAPGSGFDDLEPDPPDRYVFNVRLRYSEEGDQLTEYLVEKLDPPIVADNIAVFAQGVDDQGQPDVFGETGVKGVVSALRRLAGISEKDVVVTTYRANTVDVEAATRAILRWMAHADRKADLDGTIRVGIPMVTLFDAATSFIKAVLDEVARVKLGGQPDGKYGTFDVDELERLAHITVRFATLSTVPPALAHALNNLGGYQTKEGDQTVTRQYGEGMILANPVPDTSSNSSGVIRFREHLADFDDSLVPDPFSLEGYLVASLLGEGLKKHGPDLTTESFIETLETLSVDLGIGTTFAFSSESHQALTKLWGSTLDATLEVKPIGVLIQ